MNKGSYVNLRRIISIKQMREYGEYLARAKKAAHVNAQMSPKNILLPGDANAAVNLFYKRLRDACVKMSLVKEVPEDKDKKRRRWRALGLDVVCVVPHEYLKRSTKKWAQRTLEFLDKTFGSENVLVVVLHMDERVPHVHALVIPIAHEGCLSQTRIYAQDKEKEPEDLAEGPNTVVHNQLIGSSSQYSGARGPPPPPAAGRGETRCADTSRAPMGQTSHAREYQFPSRAWDVLSGSGRRLPMRSLQRSGPHPLRPEQNWFFRN